MPSTGAHSSCGYRSGMIRPASKCSLQGLPPAAQLARLPALPHPQQFGPEPLVLQVRRPLSMSTRHRPAARHRSLSPGRGRLLEACAEPSVLRRLSARVPARPPYGRYVLAPGRTRVAAPARRRQSPPACSWRSQPSCGGPSDGPRMPAACRTARAGRLPSEIPSRATPGIQPGKQHGTRSSRPPYGMKYSALFRATSGGKSLLYNKGFPTKSLYFYGRRLPKRSRAVAP